MRSMTKAFTAAGTSNALFVRPGETLAYAIAGTFTGYVALERAAGSGAYAQVVESAVDTPRFGLLKNETNELQQYRFRARDTAALTAFSGTANATLRVANAVSDSGVPPASSVIVGEQRKGVVEQTVLTLSAFPVTVANTTGASFGGAKVFDFPEGRILVLGVVADLSFDWRGEDIDAGGSGDFSMGSTITADATLGGTDVDLLPSTAMTDPFVVGAGAGSGALAAAAQFDGHTTALDANLNIIIDDADVADAASDVVLVSGVIVMTWVNLGDY